jgi:hypothetical protein
MPTNVIIEILEGGEPRPNPAVVRHGDTVTFHVEGGQSVDVTFGTPSCLTDSSDLALDGSNTALSSSPPRTVASSALKRGYSYSVEVIRAGVVKAGSQKETKQGTLEVETDPPKDEDKR